MLRALRIVLLASVAALVACAAAFFSGVEVSGEFLRPTLERALSAAFRLPAKLDGPLRLRTGRIATLSADALVVHDPSAGTTATLARGLRPSARIDLLALWRGTVALDEVTGERLELNLARRADGHANWAPIFARSPDGGSSSYTFDGIAKLRIGSVAGSYAREGLAPTPFEITAFEGELPRDAPIAARGGMKVDGQNVTVDFRTASLAEIGAANATAPLLGTLEWSGLRATFDGEFARDGSRLDARVHATAADAGPPLAALGLHAREPGPLDARLRLVLTAATTSVRELALRLGESVASGEASVTFGGPQPRVTANLAAERIDLRPFPAGSAAPRDKTLPEALIAWLERAATEIEAEVKLSAAEVAGLALVVREATAEARSRNLALDVTAGALLEGTRVGATLAFDARKPDRALVARIDSGNASTAALQSGTRPKGWAGSAAALRGRLEARGADPRSIVASAQGELEARDLRWSIDRSDGNAMSGRFDRLRVSVQGERAVSADVAGRLGDAACTLKVSGAGLAPLFAGEPWPVQSAAACPGERFGAKGTLALSDQRFSADLAFDVAADRPGPIVRTWGAAAKLPYPQSARGTLKLDEQSTQVRLAALRLGRTSGTGEAAWPRAPGGVPRIQLALARLDLDELGGTSHAPAPPDLLQREVFPTELGLPDLDFDITAGRVEVQGAELRQAQFSGALRSQQLPPAKFRFEWDGMAIAGQFGADFSGTTPRIEVEAATRDADLRALLKQFGATKAGLRAAALSLRVKAQGARVGEVLSSATVGVTLEQGRLDLPVDEAAGGHIDFSATFDAAPGMPTRLSAQGALGGEPVHLLLDASALSVLARPGDSLPLTLHATSGDVRLDAQGNVALDGTGKGRVHLAGRSLARLGRLIGFPLPETEPYAVGGRVDVSAAAIGASDLEVRFGQSRLSGNLQLGRAAAGRASHRAALRATPLHLEDVGGDRWLRFDDEALRQERATAQAVAQASAWLLDIVRGADFDIAFDIDSLHGAGVPLARGRLTAQAEAGAFRVQLNEVFTAGGEVNADLRVEAGATPPAFDLKARARDLEYGPLLRSLDPSTTLEGGFDFNADLTARAPPAQVMRELAGTIDAATYPRGLRSRALNLWGVGLVNGLLRQLDPDAHSSIDCAVTGFDVERGVARSRGFFVDTTRVRIVGEVEIDLVTQELSGRIDPRSKAPQLFAVAPTMLLGGTVSNPTVSAAPQNFFTVPLRFATTLGGLVGDWRSGTGRANGGPAACREAFQLLQQAGSR